MRMAMRTGTILALVLGLTVGCDNDGSTDGGVIPADTGTTDAGPQDAGSTDAGPTDAGPMDGGMTDAGVPDSGIDGGPGDGGTGDGGTDDAGMDGGAGDAGADDGGMSDAGAGDSGATDAGMTDAGMTDAGMSDAGPGMAPVAGDLVIVEIQGNPTAASDNQAEYFEVLNVSGHTLDLDGLWIAFHTWNGLSEPVMSVSKSQISGTVLIADGERALFGRSGGGFFGGRSPDVTYDDFEFNNGGMFANRLRLLVPTWGGAEPPAAADLIDGVVIDAGTFDNDFRGQSFQFNPSSGAATPTNNDDNSNWCRTATDASVEYRTDNYGTPGGPNDCG